MLQHIDPGGGEPVAPATMTPDETAVVLGLARGSVYGGIKRNEIPHERVGKRIIVSPWRISQHFNIPLETIFALLRQHRARGA